MTPTYLLFMALFSMFPTSPARSCLERRQTEVVQLATDAAERNNIPPSVLLVVGFSETHLGCDAGEAGGWGAPVDRHHRHTAGTPNTAAHILARSFEVCHTWEGAVSRFRSGMCRLPREDYRIPYVVRTLRIIELLHTRTGQPLPPAFRR